MRYLALALFTLALPLSATAASWAIVGDSNLGVARSLAPGQWVSVDVTTATDDADIIDVSGCENVDVFQFDDPDADATASTITGTVEMCPDNQSTLDTTTKRDRACAPLPNTSTLSGDDAIYGAAAVYLRIEAGGVANDDVRWQLRCSQPSFR